MGQRWSTIIGCASSERRGGSRRDDIHVTYYVQTPGYNRAGRRAIGRARGWTISTVFVNGLAHVTPHGPEKLSD